MMKKFSRDAKPESAYKKSTGRTYGERANGSRIADKALYRAVCAGCGKSCEVPFKPNGLKPVYCSQCFGHEGAVQVKNDAGLMQQFEILNAKLDQILKSIATGNAARSESERKPGKLPEKKNYKKSYAKNY